MSLKSRMDNRTFEKFSDHISLDTAKQNVWANIYKNFLENLTGCICEKIDNGVDNSGCVLHGNLENNNVDYIFVFTHNGQNKKQKVEIKTIPEYCKNFMTFKVCSLKACVEQNAYMLVPMKEKFYLYLPNCCRLLLENYPHKIYEKFSSNDLAIRIFKDQINFLVKQKQILVKSWDISSKGIIKENWSLLSKER